VRSAPQSRPARVASTPAAARFGELSVPTTTEESWRFTDLRGFDPTRFTVPSEPSETASAPRFLDLDVAGMALVTETGVEIEHAPDGIRFEPLSEADPRLYSLVGWNEYFAAHNAALWQHGVLVHVPRGVELERPLYIRIASSIPESALFYRLVVVAEEGSRFSLIEEYTSSSPDVEAYSNAVAELFVGQAAKLEYVSIQNLSQQTWHFATHHARVERDATLDWVAGGFGSKKGKIRIQNDLSGAGATSRVTGAYFADGDQHLDYDTFQEHIAPSTESDFAFKGALRESARAVWRGMIRVEETAQKTNAYQENRNLLLSPSAHADSIPGLEIMANDVRCTHGATIGRINRDELFYLMTRGLSRAEAERLIVRGFFQDVLDRIDLEPVRDALSAALEARIPEV
jgi:Fe-S cluster assembly protein SufD